MLYEDKRAALISQESANVGFCWRQRQLKRWKKSKLCVYVGGCVFAQTAAPTATICNTIIFLV